MPPDLPDHATVHCGDNREWLRALPAASIDALCCDPPAGIEFMEQEWDGFAASEPNDTGRQTGTWDESQFSGDGYERSPSPRYRGKTGLSLMPFQDFLTEVFTECHRVLKPGAHAFVWGIPKTAHHTAMALERAGFEVRDQVTHVFLSGFPKSLNVSAAIDRHLGVERTEVAGVKPGHEDMIGRTDAHAAGGRNLGWDRPWRDDPEAIARSHLDFKPATAGAEQWDGWGTALKPASEVWILARKPLGTSTVAANVLEHGVGAINIDACRVNVDGGDGGRWPPNLVMSHGPMCGDAAHSHCQPGCPVAELDTQTGARRAGSKIDGDEPSSTGVHGVYNLYARIPNDPYDDEGGGSRMLPTFRWDVDLDVPFVYMRKPPRSEKEAGLDGFEKRPLLWSSGEANPGSFQSPGTERASRNHHPTVKSVDLMRWLLRLITPPGGTVIDPFLGSGTTGVAAMIDGFTFAGCEQRPDYVDVARARIAHAHAVRDLVRAGRAKLRRAKAPADGELTLW